MLDDVNGLGQARGGRIRRRCHTHIGEVWGCAAARLLGTFKFGVRMRRILLCFAALAPLAAGCVSSIPVRTPAAQPPAAFESPQPSAANLQPQAIDRWWTLYGDAQLESLVELALANAPDARDALAKLTQAAAIRTGTLDQLYLPSGAPSGTATRTDTTILSGPVIPGFGAGGVTTSLNANFNVSWELDLFGRRDAGRKTANADFYNAAFTYEATRTALAANVAQSLFQARGLALQLRDSGEIARADRDLLKVSQAKFDRGLAASGDLDQATANAEAADAQAESVRAQLAVARRTLLVLVGKGFDPLTSLEAAAEIGTPPPVPSTLPGDLLRRRPDVRSAEFRIMSASGTLKTNELALLPTLKVNPGLTLAKSIGPFGQASEAWSIGGNLTAPVLDRPRLIAQVHAQRAVAEQAVIAYEKAVQTAYSDAENAFTYLDSDSRRVVMLQSAEQRAESAYKKARLGYDRGLNDIQTALNAENTWRNTRTQLSNAKSTLMQRSVQVFKALGGGWSSDQPASNTPYAAKAAAAIAEGGR